MSSAIVTLPEYRRQVAAQKAKIAKARITPEQMYNERKKRAAESKRLEHPGRNMGKPHGTWVTDMAEERQGIVLCSSCQHKFRPEQYHYYRTREFQIIGRCDACKQHHNQGNTFFIHESLLGRQHGQCWTPR